MKIGIQTWGSDGDIRPFIALASGLKSAGHEVTLAYTSVDDKDYSGLADAIGIRLIRAGIPDVSPEDFEREIASFFRISSPLKQALVLMRDYFNPMVPEIYRASEALCDENELVIGHLLVHPLRAASDKAGRPYVCVLLTHMLPSRHYPPMGMPDLGRVLNPMLWGAAGFLINRLMLPMDNSLRREVGLTPIRDLMRSLREPKHLNLIAVSPSLFERPADWDERQKVCGFLNMPPADEPWEMPRGLKDFIDAGPRPVYMTFGSMLTVNTAALEQSTRLMVDAALKAGCRAIVQTAWDGAGELKGCEDIYFIKRAPHQNIFPLCSAVVHHGGAGSTQSATMAGCPSVVVPHVLDQPIWAGVLGGLGVAPRPLPRIALTADKLANAIMAVLNNDQMRQRARSIGRKMKHEDGVGSAVAILEERFMK